MKKISIVGLGYIGLPLAVSFSKYFKVVGFDKDKEIASASIQLYEELTDMGYDVLLDDRKDGYGAKMKDSELIGIPLNIIIGKSFLENQDVELKGRNGQSSSNPISDII